MRRAMQQTLCRFGSVIFTGVTTLQSAAWASQPTPWQMGLQPAASPVMHEIASLYGVLSWIIIAIVGLVSALLAYVMVRFNARRNPTPTKTTHNTLLEVIWTGLPVLIFLAIAVPSFKLLYFMDRVETAEMTLKVVGRQWYWSYEYPDHGGFAYDSFMVPDDELVDGQPRLLAVDEAVVLPINTNIRILVTSDDVIHSWAVPALGLKTDGLAGRVNETWVRITRQGTYYGQCSELCGVNHGFMPVAIKAVSKADFADWVKAAQEEFQG